ncbi:class I SAM-dependent methyltransferase [Phosphitispora fastidiosa]|uniref:class I SAM-dependent methyltransferase n=1 Tax=Phosphitispora fastidiosa TaxID=2837202 RepID=UPI001E44F707|nr:protein N-lysine methyltransferase family protein [Phosphitispora fastidiosa]MBU7007267.1 putative nicotinamide N-methyase [Phosphitispora fastidiosa]
MGYTSETTVMFPGKTFKINVVEDVDYLLDLVETDDDVPFWAVLWPAALGMAEYFWQNTAFGGKRILELGAGLGLVGIVAAAKGAEVVQTDFISEALQLAEQNARINGISKIQRVLADWREFPLDERFDLIIGSDILYEPTLHPFLKEIFQNNLKPGGTVVLADPGRDDAKSFISMLQNEGYQTNTVTKEVFETGRRICVSIYFLNKSGG